MKNILILIVAAAVFLHFYPQPELEDWYEEQKAMVLEVFGEATSTKVRLNKERVYADITKQFSSFRENERERARDITMTRSDIKDYFFEYCPLTKKRDHKFHSDNQRKVCQIMSQYSKYF